MKSKGLILVVLLNLFMENRSPAQAVVPLSDVTLGFGAGYAYTFNDRKEYSLSTDCKKDLLFLGMLLQGIALIVLLFAQSMLHFIFLSAILGLGTAMVYPTFLATIAENTHPADRANSLGIFRFWRDLGYAIGAILTGIIADTLGIYASILIIGLLTIGSALIILYRMKCVGNDAVKILNWISGKTKKIEASCSSKINYKVQIEQAYQPCI